MKLAGPSRLLSVMLPIARWLQRHCLAFACVLFAIRSLAHPYAGLVHDAKLYALQIANRAAGGAYQEDLFFAFGSQDSFSLISVVLAPLSRVFGIPATMFVSYVVCQFALGLAMVAFVTSLRLGRLWGTFALLGLTVCDMAYGGLYVFHVQEAFFTARLPAVVMVVLSLALLLQGRRWWSLATTLAAVMIHPLMAIGGVAIVCANLIVTYGGRRWGTSLLCLGVVSILALAASPLALSIFPQTIDGTWDRVCRDVSPHCYPSLWQSSDYGRIAVQFALVALASLVSHPRVRCLLAPTLLLAFAGMALAVIGERSGVAILLQGQPFRSLWILALVSLPAGLIVIRWCWRQQTLNGILSANLAASLMLGSHSEVGMAWMIPAAAVVVLWLIRARQSVARHAYACLAASWIAVIIADGLNCWSTLPVVWSCLPDIGSRRLLIPRMIPLSILLGVSVGILYWLVHAKRTPPVVLRSATLAIIMNWFVSGFVGQSYPLGTSADLDSLGLVRRVIASSPSTRRPRIYWPLDAVAVWEGLGGVAYHDFAQVSGVIFSRYTAEEAARRSQIVKPFEVATMKAMADQPALWQRPLGYLHASWNAPLPTSEDLERLRDTDDLDWIVLPFRVDDTFVATNGHVFVYAAK